MSEKKQAVNVNSKYWNEELETMPLITKKVLMKPE